MAPNTASLTRRLWLWLVPAVYRPPAYHPTGPWTWPCMKGDAGRQQVTGRRERCGKPFYGNAAEGKRSATEALELSRGREVQYAAGLALAFSGDSSRSEALAGDLEKRFPEDAFVKFTDAPHSVTRKA